METDNKWNPPSNFSGDFMQYLHHLLQLINNFCWIFNEKNINVFTRNWWDNVPQSWREDLLNSSSIEIRDIVNGSYKKSWDPTLVNYISDCKKLSMPRDENFEVPFNFKPMHKLDKLLTYGMKEKKIHEVENVSHLIARISSEEATIIDIGAGKGYISQILSRFYDFDVVNLEGHQGHVQEAETLNKQLEKFFIHKERVENKQSKSQTVMIHHFIENPPKYEVLDNLIEEKFKILKKKEYTLISLHGCGDLSTSVLKLFTQWPAVKSLVCVGCCFLKLTTGVTKDEEQSFPLSKELKKRLVENPNLLGNIKRFVELATETPALFSELDEKTLELRENQLFYRAVLEMALKKIEKSDISKSHISIRRARSKALSQNFEVWLDHVLKKLAIKEENKWKDPKQIFGDQFEEIKEEIKQIALETYRIYLKQKKKCLINNALRLTISEACESLIILDRYLYLKEFDEIEPIILPIFSHKLSPRNLSLIATKKK